MGGMDRLKMTPAQRIRATRLMVTVHSLAKITPLVLVSLSTQG
jgi:hypothetical protein